MGQALYLAQGTMTDTVPAIQASIARIIQYVTVLELRVSPEEKAEFLKIQSPSISQLEVCASIHPWNQPAQG